MASLKLLQGLSHFIYRKFYMFRQPRHLLKESKTVLMGSFFELLGHLFSEKI